MDEVMADTLSEHLRRYNEAFDENLETADLWGKGLWDVVADDRQTQLRAFLDADDFFADLSVMPDAPEVMHDLATRFEVFVATQAMTVPSSFGPKYRWLQRHFPFLTPARYVYCGDKSILRADYLIDDTAENLQKFTGIGLLFDAPHNRGAQGFTRLMDWREVREYFRQI